MNVLRLGDALRRLFPDRRTNSSFDRDVERLEDDFRRDHERALPPRPAPMTADDGLFEVLTSHASGRWRYLDVRRDEQWRRERLDGAINIPLERLELDVVRTFTTDTSLAVYGADARETDAAAAVLRRLGYDDVLPIPAGFEWFRKREWWQIDRGPRSR